MNAIPLLPQSQRSNDELNFNLSEKAHSPVPPAKGQDFAAALNKAHAEPARKSNIKDQHPSETSGGHLPQLGNPTPSAVPAATTGVAAARQSVNDRGDRAPAAGAPAAASPAGVTATPPGTPAASAPGAGAAAPAANGVAPPSNASAPESNIAAAQPSVKALAAGDQAMLSAVLVLQGAPSTAPITSAPSAAVARTPAIPAAGIGPRPIAAAIATEATSALDSSNGTLNGAVAPDTDNAAQVVMADAHAQGSTLPLTNSPDLAVSDAGTALAREAAPAPGVPIAPGPAAGSPAPVSGPPSAAAAAATAASIAQVVSAAGSQAGADKHSRGGGPDAFQPGASNDGAAAAQLLSSATPSAADASPIPAFKVSAGVDSAEFGQGVANHVGIMMDGNLSSAKLQVNPPALGPIEVRIALQAGHAQVWLTSHSAITRDALESSAPKLREMLGAQGFAEVSVDISQRSFQERSPQPRSYEGLAAITPDSIAAVGSAPAHTASGLLDAYA